ncbi:MAG: hypothetical protein V1871_04080 [Planctomycetota bacterium]
MKCENCIYYKPTCPTVRPDEPFGRGYPVRRVDTKRGDCWGRKIEGNADPKDIKICQGRYFKKTDPIINQIKYLFILGRKRTSLWI